MLTALDYYNQPKKGQVEKAINLLPVLVPTFFELSFEQIYELKQHMNDEIAELRLYIDGLPEYSEEEYRAVKQKIATSIKQLESKYFSLKASTLQRLLGNIKNPLSYSPLLTTFFADVPPAVALLTTVAFVATDAALEYKKGKRELEADPLYCSVRIRKHIH